MKNANQTMQRGHLKGTPYHLPPRWRWQKDIAFTETPGPAIPEHNVPNVICGATYNSTVQYCTVLLTTRLRGNKYILHSVKRRRQLTVKNDSPATHPSVPTASSFCPILTWTLCTFLVVEQCAHYTLLSAQTFCTVRYSIYSRQFSDELGKYNPSTNVLNVICYCIALHCIDLFCMLAYIMVQVRPAFAGKSRAMNLLHIPRLLKLLGSHNACSICQQPL